MRVGLAAMLAMAATAAHAQGIDCSRARSAPEKAICASPALLSLDRQVAIAYADAQARAPDRRDAMRTELLAWLRTRDAACNVPSARLEQCLSGQLTARLAALTPKPAQPPAQAPVAAPAPTVPIQAAAPPVPADPAIPPATFAPPPGSATLDAASVPAAAEASTLLRVTAPGRFTVAAHSPAGAALQLVDMLTGPSEVAGSAGAQDGRLDRLLDVGTYKLRVFPAPGATGDVGLTVTPFRDAAPPAALPLAGRDAATTLRDTEQRGYWVLVPPATSDGEANVRIEAAGRSLGDLRLWRNGRELAALQPARLAISPSPDQPLTDLRLEGRVEPGTYLAIAYGGPRLPWTDNNPAEPMLVRSGLSDALADGWAGGTLGPMGSAVFAVPPGTGLLRLTLPAPAPAELHAGEDVAAIAKNSREPTTTLPIERGKRPAVEVRGAAGQSFTLRALDPVQALSWSRPGTWWVGAATTGMGGDEVPPSFALVRTEPDAAPRLLASTAPVIGGGAPPWRARFNLRGPTDILIQTPGGDTAFSSSGVPIRQARSARGDLPPGFLLMDLTPQTGALGSLEVTLGTPGATPPPLAPVLPADPVVPFGVQALARGQALHLLTGDAPGATAGLSVRPSPVPLVEGPLLVTVPARNSVSIPVRLAPGGTLRVSEVGAGPIAAGQTDNTEPGRATVVVPLADRARTVALSWHRTELPPPPISAPPPVGSTPTVTAGQPAFFDLARGEERGFALLVPEGGLFRVETLGRLHTVGRLGSAFTPRVASGDGNGAGLNMLIQTALRAGRYRVDVRAVGSAGHLGLSASPAPLLAGETLRPGGTARASLPGGSGAAFPMEIAAAGRYRLDALALGAAWTGRLEDPDGWPVVTPGALDGLEVALRPGRYRLVVEPGAVARQVVLRLAALVTTPPVTGHGPHALPFDRRQTATWREPEGRDQPRTPDTWHFTLAGPGTVTLALGDGMVGELDGPGGPRRVVGSWTGPLAAGGYALLATSLGRNDRLDYTVRLTSPDLQPDTPRSVTVPGSATFSLAEPRVASLLSWGTVPVGAVLRQEGGGVVARYGSRPDDWNIAASRMLPAGRYVLDLLAAVPPALTARPGPPAPADADSSDDDPPADQGTEQTAATTGAAPPAKTADSDSDSDSSTDTPDTDAVPPKPRTMLTLALPPALPPMAAPVASAPLTGAAVHVLTLPQPATGTLVVAAAQASAPAVLTLERAEGDGWRTVALATGREPVVAAPADASDAAWRVESWVVDGGDMPVMAAARTVSAPSVAGDTTRMTALDGMPVAVAVGRASLPQLGIATVSGGTPGLLAGGWPGHALTAASGPVVLAGPDLWLLQGTPGELAVRPLDLAAGRAVPLDLPAGLGAALPMPSVPDGHVGLWRAQSGAGRPYLGPASGVAPTGSVALAGEGLTLSGSGAMRVDLRRETPELVPTEAVGTTLAAMLKPGTAMPVNLPPGAKRMELDLAPGLAAFAGWQGPAPEAVWAADAPLTQTMHGDWTALLLVNLSAAPAAARVAVQAAPAPPTLVPGQMMRRSFAGAGSESLPFDAPPGSHIRMAGHGSVTVLLADALLHGRDVPVSGRGRLVVAHGTGPVAVWLESPGTPAWPSAPVQPVTLPARPELSGAAMALRVTSAAPALLHLDTATPVFTALDAAEPELFPAGAALHRLIPAGETTLRIYPAGDAPLGGTADVWTEPLIPLGDGLGETVALPPGGGTAFGFSLPKPMKVGVGVRADPDRATARLLDAAGRELGHGVALLRDLPAGDYVLLVTVPPTAPTTVIRPALVGTKPPGNGPPPDVVRSYLELAGMKPKEAP